MRNMVKSSLAMVDLTAREKARLSFQSMKMLMFQLHTLKMGHF